VAAARRGGRARGRGGSPGVTPCWWPPAGPTPRRGRPRGCARRRRRAHAGRYGQRWPSRAGQGAAYRWFAGTGPARQRLVEGVGTDYVVRQSPFAWSGGPHSGWPGMKRVAGEPPRPRSPRACQERGPHLYLTDAQEVQALLPSTRDRSLRGPYERERYGVDEGRLSWYREWLSPAPRGPLLFRRP
jgi:hypothetical protein